MKQNLTLCMLIVTISVIFILAGNTFSQDPDTLDVAPGFETLNLAVLGDTTETGEPKNLNRVYRLERGEYYLLNGSITTVNAAPCRVVAAKGDGPKPLIIPAVSESGSAARAFRPGGDVEAKGLYITGIDNLGNQAEKNMFRCGGVGARIVVDNCFLDHDAQCFVRMDGDDQKLFLTNSVVRNSINLAKPNNGRFIMTRASTQDTVFVQNCTMYMGSHNPIQGSGMEKNLILDHVTIYQTRGHMEIRNAVNYTVTNCLFIDYDFEGNWCDPANPDVDSLTQSDFIGYESLDAEVATDEQRNLSVKNNVFGWTPEILTVFSTHDSIKATPIQNITTQTFFNTFPNMIYENNIEECPAFSDAPDPSVVAAYATYRIETHQSDENNPDPRADRNGMAALDVDPTSVGPAADEFDFDYNTDAAAYTHAEGEFPAGDLNWFPDKKAEWETWIATGVESKNMDAVPAAFALNQNYPNPFNPSTTIAYQLKSNTKVNLDVYNSLGQHVRTLVNNEQKQAGSYKTQWNGLNDAGQHVASGIYMYRLKAGDQVQTMKMVMMK